MNILKILAAILTISLSIVTLIYLPLWVYFGFNALYLGVFYLKNKSVFGTGFIIFTMTVGAPSYAYIIMENLIDGNKWNHDT